MTERGRRVGVALLVAALASVGCSASDAPVGTSATVSAGPSTSTVTPSTGGPSTPSPTAPTVETVPSTVPSSTPVATDCGWLPCYAEPADGGTLPDSVGEASGIAASSVDPDLYFVVDDGTGTGSLTAVHGDGSLVGVVTVEGMSADNAEALAAGPCPDGRCLYIGDIGGSRDAVTVDRISEPEPPLPATVDSETRTYRYPDGAFDAEALLVTDDGGVVIVTKPDGGKAPHRVYSGPPGGGDLTLRTTFTPPTPTVPARSMLVGNVVTDATRGPDTVLLLTYDQATEYRAPSPGADPADFPTWERRPVPLPQQWQSEGVSHAAAGACGYVVVSEKSPVTPAEIGAVGCA